MFSPKLRRFLANNSNAAVLLSKTLSEAFTNRAIQIYYFYSNGEPDAFHSYPESNSVIIAVRENIQPLDEFLGIMYESLNSENAPSFVELCHRAELGTISKVDFAQEILRLEFNAEKRLRTFRGDVKLSYGETSKSKHYKRMIDCPGNFQEFLTYSQKVALPQDPIREDEKQYEVLRKQ
jgi:hypothetical protein